MTNENETTNEPHPNKGKQPLTGKKLTRHVQLQNTQELGSIKLIEETDRVLALILGGLPIGMSAAIANLSIKKNQEIIRLRRALVNERTHRERLTNSLLPRLRSKANECRNLRAKIDGLNEKSKIERAKRKARNRKNAKKIEVS